MEERRQVRIETKQKLKADTMEAVDQIDKTIQRMVGKNMLKNRGLTRKRPKKFSNPRLKRRIQYETMMKKRKSVVQEYKKG